MAVTEQPRPAPLVSVVIVSWNVRALLLDAIASIYASAAGSPVEVIVVDNASRDDSVEAVRSAYPGIVVIANADNAGYSRANNQGALAARGRYILFLNPDTRVLGDAIAAMARTLDEAPDIGALGAKLLTREMTWSRENGFQLPTLRTVANEYLGLSRLIPVPALFPGIVRSRDFHGLEDCGWICGAALMVRRAVVEQELWNEQIFLFAEDVDYCARIRARGWRIVELGSALVVHYSGQSLQQPDAVVPANKTSGLTSMIRQREGRAAEWLAIHIVQASMWLRSWFHRLRYFASGDQQSLAKADRLRKYLSLEGGR